MSGITIANVSKKSNKCIFAKRFIKTKITRIDNAQKDNSRGMVNVNYLRTKRRFLTFGHFFNL